MFKQVQGLFILLLTLVLSALFSIVKTDDRTEYSFFCNDINRLCISEVELTINTFVYFLFEHLILVIFSIYILLESTKFRMALKVFMWIQIVDVFDYLIAYGQTWFYLSGYPMSWNILKVSVFTLAIAQEVLNIIEEKTLMR